MIAHLEILMENVDQKRRSFIDKTEIKSVVFA